MKGTRGADPPPPRKQLLLTSSSFAATYIHRSGIDGDPLSSENARDTTRLWTPCRTTFRFFRHRNAKYVWNADTATFVRLCGYDRGEQGSIWRNIFGRNLRTKLSIKTRKILALIGYWCYLFHESGTRLSCITLTVVCI
jgi:hypothetical protein